MNPEKGKIKSSEELEIIREATRISTEIMHELRLNVAPGVSAAEIDRLAGELCKKAGVIPAFKNQPGYVPFPGNLCVCVNEEVLHAVPKEERIFEKGDLVKIDFGVIYNNFYTDHCTTVAVSELLPEDEKLMKVGKFAVESAVKKVKNGVKVGDLGHTMQTITEMAGFNVLKDYVGHGIGRSLHEYPQIPAFGTIGQGAELKTGMVICVEAQVVKGKEDVYVTEDKWTVATKDGEKAVMFEYMVAVTDEGSEVLTKTMDWPLVIFSGNNLP